MDLGLSGKKALVTAASRGIGLAIAQQLAEEGVDVALCARGAGGLESARKELEARGVRVFAQAVDVADERRARGASSARPAVRSAASTCSSRTRAAAPAWARTPGRRTSRST